MIRLQAFSLIEMLVVMLLSSMTVGTIYFAYYSINTYYVRLSAQHKQLERTGVFLNQLSADIDECLSVTRLSGGMLCSKTEHAVEYRFFPEYVIRRQLSITDTFPDVSAVAFRYRNYDIEEERYLVDEVEVNVRLHDRQVTMHFMKDYEPAVTLRFHEKSVFGDKMELSYEE